MVCVRLNNLHPYVGLVVFVSIMPAVALATNFTAGRERALTEYKASHIVLPRHVKQAFETAYTSPKTYEPGRCHENVQRFLKKTGLTPSDQKQFHVLVLATNNKKERPLMLFHLRKPEQVQGEEYVRNYHHVIARRGRYIFDLATPDATPVPFEYYLESMLQHKLGSRWRYVQPKYDYANDLSVIEVPRDEFLGEQNSLVTYEWLFRPGIDPNS